MDARTNLDSVSQHYGRPEFAATIFGALRAAGKDPDRLTTDDLATVDEFHSRGREATRDLARLAGFHEGMNVLDVGGGIGGPARILASEFGCTVTVLDLTPEFCETGAMLTSRVGLTDRVTFRQGSALAIPFADESFDAVWTQHSSMNIADKERLYREIHRVLRPGGRLALYDIMAGTVSPIHFPVPWAKQPEISHLARPETVRELLQRFGFREMAWIDETNRARLWFEERLAAASSSTPPLGVNVAKDHHDIERY